MNLLHGLWLINNLWLFFINYLCLRLLLINILWLSLLVDNLRLLLHRFINDSLWLLNFYFLRRALHRRYNIRLCNNLLSCHYRLGILVIIINRLNLRNLLRFLNYVLRGSRLGLLLLNGVIKISGLNLLYCLSRNSSRLINNLIWSDS